MIKDSFTTSKKRIKKESSIEEGLHPYDFEKPELLSYIDHLVESRIPKKEVLNVIDKYLKTEGKARNHKR